MENISELKLIEKKGLYYYVVCNGSWRINKENYKEVEQYINNNDFGALTKYDYEIRCGIYDFKLTYSDKKTWYFRYDVNQEKQIIEPELIERDTFDDIVDAQNYLKQEAQKQVDYQKKYE